MLDKLRERFSNKTITPVKKERKLAKIVELEPLQDMFPEQDDTFELTRPD